MALKKKTPRKSKRNAVSRSKTDRWDIKKIILPLGVAVFAVFAASSATYTQRFSRDVLGEESSMAKQETRGESVRQQEQMQAEEASQESQENRGPSAASGSRQQNGVERETSDQASRTSNEDGGARKREAEQETVRYMVEEKDGKMTLKALAPSGDERRGADREQERKKLEQELEDADIEIASADGYMKLVRNAVEARVRFPLSVDPATGQLTVTTPAGVKTVAILPDAAVARLLSLGVLSDVALHPVAQRGATDSGVPNARVELTLEDNNLVYKIEGSKQHRLFGFIPVAAPRTVTISALTGNVVSQTQSWLVGLIDLVSL